MDGTRVGERRPRASRRPWRRVLACAALALLVPACYSDGQFNILGYTTKPNFDRRWKTVRVNIFKNKTFWQITPVAGMEMDLTQAIVQEIRDKTPYHVVGAGQPADTELSGTVIGFTKSILSYNQLYEVRESETTLVCNVVWRECATGKLLSQVGRPTGDLTPPDVPLGPQPLGASSQASGLAAQTPIVSTPGQPSTGPLYAVTPAPAGQGTPPPNPSAPGLPDVLQGVQIRSIAHFRPELGESITTALQKNYSRMGVQIVNMMEVPW